MRARAVAALAAILLLGPAAVARGDTIEYVSSDLMAVYDGASLALVATGGSTTEQFVNGTSVATFATTDFGFSAPLDPVGAAMAAGLAAELNGATFQASDLTAGAVDFSGAAASQFLFGDFVLDGVAVGTPLRLSFFLPTGWDPSQTPFVEGVTARLAYDTTPVVPLPAAAWGGLALLAGVASVRRVRRHPSAETAL